MSKGLGKVEKDLLEALDNPWFQNGARLNKVARTLIEITPLASILGAQIGNYPMYTSLKRAARSLERKGYLERYSYANQSYIKLVKRTCDTGTLNSDES